MQKPSTSQKIVYPYRNNEKFDTFGTRKPQHHQEVEDTQRNYDSYGIRDPQYQKIHEDTQTETNDEFEKQFEDKETNMRKQKGRPKGSTNVVKKSINKGIATTLAQSAEEINKNHSKKSKNKKEIKMYLLVAIDRLCVMSKNTKI